VRAQIRPALMVLLILTLVTGVIYPLVITGVAQLIFPGQANGSLVKVDGQVVGSALIGQALNAPGYFWPRPSVIEYNPMPSSGSNLGPTSQALLEQVQQRVVDMLEREGLLDEVLAMGLEFQVGSKGDRLSGGQRQKIALARAFLKNPHILIMDEATASLDNASQSRIQQLLETEFRGRCTVVAVVHRLVGAA